MRFVLVAISFFLFGCVSSPGVISLPSGNLLATGFASPVDGGPAAAQNAALAIAFKHCEALGRRVEVVELTSANTDDVEFGATDVEFKCVPDV